MFLIAMLVAILFYIGMLAMVVSFGYLKEGRMFPAFLVGLFSVFCGTLLVLGATYIGAAMMLMATPGNPVFNI